MTSRSVTESLSITQGDVLYVGQQINLDLIALSNAYPTVLSKDRAMNLFNSYTTLLYNNAVSSIGFSIYDPRDGNLVYHENRYKVLYGDAVREINPSGRGVGRGGKPVQPVRLPSSATFTAWVMWSSRMLGLSVPEQERIVSGTGWDIPGKNPKFVGEYRGGKWTSTGFIGRGGIGVEGEMWILGLK